MDKIIIEDKDLNEKIFYTQSEDTDIFIEKYLAESSNPDSLKINFYLMEKEQIEALKFLNESDWYMSRKIDVNKVVPDEIVEERGTARDIL
jgi:hypothetical protein